MNLVTGRVVNRTGKDRGHYDVTYAADRVTPASVTVTVEYNDNYYDLQLRSIEGMIIVPQVGDLVTFEPELRLIIAIRHPTAGST